jgi:Putative zinc-finger
MTEQHCIYPDREAAIVAYLYDDLDGFQRVAFETHVATCEPCRTELADLRDVRSTLAQWAAPETARSRPSPIANRQMPWWNTVPVWAQVAAAMLVLGVSASIANLDVRYDRANGLNVRTGWSKSVAAPQPQADAAPWRAELAAAQKQLRAEMNAKSAAVAAASVPTPTAMSDAEVRRRVGVLIDESERKQQKELALQLVQLQQDLRAQRQSDLGQVYRALGLFQNTTQGELANQRQALRMAVSQTR